MSRLATLGGVLVVAAVILAGCGGGGGSAGGTPVPPGSTASTQQVFILDFVHRTVSTSVQAQFVERNPGQAAAALALTITFPPVSVGSPGQEQMTATVKNNTTGPVGANDLGTVTGIDLCFVSTVFKNAGGIVVTGGGYAGYGSLNPATGTPVFSLPQSLAPGANSNGALVSIILPATATTATVTVIVRAATAFANPPSLNGWYLTTLAGQGAVAGYRDGPAAQALFNGARCSLYREDVGDLLVTDYNNRGIRRIYQGQVTTFTARGLNEGQLGTPQGLGRDAAGNVYFSDPDNSRVEVLPAAGGQPFLIALTFGLPAGLAVTGDLVYVCNPPLQTVNLLTYNGVADRFNVANWSRTDITNGAGFITPTGVAVDNAGNVYVTDADTNKIYILPMGSATWTVIAGSGAPAEGDFTGLSAAFYQPVGIAVDQAGILYVADYHSSLRRLSHTGGSLTDPTTWKVETLVHWNYGGIPVDGFTSTGKVFNLTGVSCARDGTLYLTEDNDVRRLDRVRN